MRSRRIAASLAVVSAVVVAQLPAQVPAQAAKAAVSMSVAALPASVIQGSRVTVSGRAYHGSSGNAAPVDVYFKALSASGYRKVTSTRAASSGSFRVAITASASGTVEVVYAGNSVRAGTTRYAALSVYVMSSAGSTVFTRAGQSAQPCPVIGKGGGNACDRYASALIAIPAHATLHFSWTVTDVTYGRCSIQVGYSKDGSDRPADNNDRWHAEMSVKADDGSFALPAFDLTPGLTNGKFFFSGGYMTWGVTITETHPIHQTV